MKKQRRNRKLSNSDASLSLYVMWRHTSTSTSASHIYQYQSSPNTDNSIASLFIQPHHHFSFSLSPQNSMCLSLLLCSQIPLNCTKKRVFCLSCFCYHICFVLFCFGLFQNRQVWLERSWNFHFLELWDSIVTAFDRLSKTRKGKLKSNPCIFGDFGQWGWFKWIWEPGNEILRFY